MRVLLISFSNCLEENFTIFNPNLEICAIVVDEVEQAREIVKKYNIPDNMIFPYSHLKECIENFYFDYVVNSTKNNDLIIKDLENYISLKNKIVNIVNTEPTYATCSPTLVMEYYKNHAKDFKIFGTGMSYFALGIDITQFSLPFINLANISQDLYYDYKIAKRIVSIGGGIAVCNNWTCPL